MATIKPVHRQPGQPAGLVPDGIDASAKLARQESEEGGGLAHFFKPEDWLASAATFLISSLVFFHHMAPEVTLQDSGELVTGAFNFGVPHPPGYPLWALLGYIWSHVVVPFGSPAWRIGLFSVFTGGLTVGVLTLVMTRSTRVLLHTLPWTRDIEERLLHWIAMTVGISMSLLFGFNRGVWLWACVSEMRVLNAFSFVLIACTFFGWLTQPQRKGFLYATLLIFGLSMTNHQTVGVMAGALVVGTFAEGIDRFFKQRTQSAGMEVGLLAPIMEALTTFWELAVAVLFSAAAGFLLFAWLRAEPKVPLTQQPDFAKTVGLFAAGLITLIGMRLGGWLKVRRSMLYTVLFLAGCAFYLYMPVAAWTNPPMNWGYAGTKEGFLHAITRGQYEKLQMADPFGSVFGIQIWIFLRGLLKQYSLPVFLFGLITLLVPTFGIFIRGVRSGTSRHILKTWFGGMAAIAAVLYLCLSKLDLGWAHLTTGDMCLVDFILIPLLAFVFATALCVWVHCQRWMIYLWLATVPVAMALMAVLHSKILDLPLDSLLPALYWGIGSATILCMLVSAWLYQRWPGGSWMVFVWAAFFVTSIGLIMIINPKLDRQEQEITIKFFAPAHGFYAMLIGYGIALAIGAVLRFWRDAPRLLIQVACVGLLALPLITYKTNWSLCALGGHDFGYQFGYRMFCPGGGYPNMEKDAVLYGGTDPGRFVPTYMIFCESRVPPKDRFRDPHLPGDGSTFDRSDVYIITQNALADNTYMSYIRDHYDYSRPDITNAATLASYSPLRQFVYGLGCSWLGRDHTYPQAPIYIPSPDDSARAFQKFVEDVQSGRTPAGSDVKVENGRVSVTGVQGVMAINGILAQWIFEKNKDKHAFYVEESYVIPWMYPYLRPAGVIMKIEKDPLPAPQQDPKLWQSIVAQDKAYWDKLTVEFTNREEFCRNNDAKKSFSKMRSAIAGLYVSRGMVAEAEYAFRQSLVLCPESPEGCFRLADLYMQQRRYEDARVLMEEYHALDPYNGNVTGFLGTITEMVRSDARRHELEKALAGGGDLNAVMELIAVYGRLKMGAEFANLTMRVLDTTNMPPTVYLQVAQLCSDSGQIGLAAESLKRYLRHDPLNARMWIELAFTQLGMGQTAETQASLRKAVETGGDAARAQLRKDQRFQRLWNTQQFQGLMQPAAPLNLDLGMP